MIVTWRSASRAEQFLCVAIVLNVAAYQITTIPRIFSAYEMSAVLPCGAVLAARAVVPATISGLRRGRIVAAVAGMAALLPLAAAASVAPATGFGNTTLVGSGLIPWLEAHHLSYGLASYWNSSESLCRLEQGRAAHHLQLPWPRRLDIRRETQHFLDTTCHDTTPRSWLSSKVT